MQHLTDIASLNSDSVTRLFAIADSLRKAMPARPLAGVTAVNLFYEASTRTRAAFELAAKQLGADVINLQSQTSSVIKGESLVDTFHNLCAMGIRLFNVRHPKVGSSHQLAELAPDGVHIINAGDGVHAHPTQALLDAYTLSKNLGDLTDKVIVIAGDLRHSRVARSNIALLNMLGAREIRLAAPQEMQISPAPAGNIIEYSDLDSATAGADAIMMLRIQRERITEMEIPDALTYHRQWGLTKGRLATASADCKVLHPGPVNREVEISSEVLDGPQSLVLQQVQFGVFVRMAVMLEMLRPGYELNSVEC